MDTSPPQYNHVVAALLSLLVPGLGQIACGRILRGLLWFVFTAIGYGLLIVPGVILHLTCIFCAAIPPRRR